MIAPSMTYWHSWRFAAARKKIEIEGAGDDRERR
jgi:hypothetical protein